MSPLALALGIITAAALIIALFAIQLKQLYHRRVETRLLSKMAQKLGVPQEEVETILQYP